MKFLKQLAVFGAAATALVACLSAHANETLNISYAAAAVTGYDNCMAIADVGWMDADPYGVNAVVGCHVTFALPVPAGHTVLQISVLHGTYCDNNMPCYDPNTLKTSAYLFKKGISGQANGTGDYAFQWQSANAVLPLGSVETKKLMTQVNGFYADQFLVQADHVYFVDVEARNFATITGLQVIYN